jgi:hypothetical protein
MGYKVSLRFYVYAYIRSEDSVTAKAGTPYYIGKGTGNRAFSKHTFTIPDKSRIIFMEQGLTELGALALERRYIKWWGRKDLGTGVLLNRTDGGDSPKMDEYRKLHLSKINTGKVLKEETCIKMSKTRTGKKRPELSNRSRTPAELSNLAGMTQKVKLIVEIQGITYDSITAASMVTGIHHETLRYRCRATGFPDYKILGRSTCPA